MKGEIIEAYRVQGLRFKPLRCFLFCGKEGLSVEKRNCDLGAKNSYSLNMGATYAFRILVCALVIYRGTKKLQATIN